LIVCRLHQLDQLELLHLCDLAVNDEMRLLVVIICQLVVAGTAVVDQQSPATLGCGSSQLQHQTAAAAADIVECANRSLVEMPASLPADTTTLDLSHNHISLLTAQQTAHLFAVEVLRLHNNMLTAISGDAFVNCTSLRSLYLDHNALSSMSFVSGTQSLQELYVSFNRMTTLEAGSRVLLLTVLDMSFNLVHHFNCSCLLPLQNVRTLNLSHNLIEAVLLNEPSVLSSSRVGHLDLSSNRLRTLTLCSECFLYDLHYLDVSSNRLVRVEPSWCHQLPNLTVLIASDNPVSSVLPDTFAHCSSLYTLHLTNLLIDELDADVFRGLSRLRTLRLDHNSRLVSLQRQSFQYLDNLVELDLRGCQLTTLAFLLSAVSKVLVVELADNPWQCDCEQSADVLVAVSEWNVSETTAVCAAPASVRGQSLLNVSDQCRAPTLYTRQQTVWTRVGTELLVHCNATGDSPLNITWFSKHNGDIVPVRQTASDAAAADANSLHVASVSRATAGLYYCIVRNKFGTETMVVSVRLNSDVISLTTLYSIIIGLLSAAGFFLVAVVIGIVRYLAYLCSTKERRKRKSIRAVLESIQDYKCAQFDRFSAYRSAKMDQLSAFKSAKIEQLSAFRDARVDRLRTYKQATVASILTHIERMREHYAAQTARIKDNCAQQADRLREHYTARRGRFNNYRSQHVDKMRENYAAQAARIREYGMVQMSRLREQYKTQQQHVLKLVELLDVGSCVSGVIEAECMKAESMIFDADIAFDFEAQPAHACCTESLLIGGGQLGGDGESLSASSDSDLSLDYSVTCVADVTATTQLHEAAAATTRDDDDDEVDDIDGVLAVADDVLRQIEMDASHAELHADVAVPSQNEMIRVRRSSLDTAPADNSVGCLEMVASEIHVDCLHGPEAAQQDTRC